MSKRSLKSLEGKEIGKSLFIALKQKRHWIMIIFTDRRSRTKQPLKRVTGGPLRSGATK